MTDGAEDRLISVKEAATECGRNPETVRRWIWNGKLPAEKLGNQLFIRRNALMNFCRETVAAPIGEEASPDFMARAIALQDKMKARGVEPLDPAEVIR